MSTASAVSTRNAAVNNFNGGEPISKDLVPAIVFSALVSTVRLLGIRTEPFSSLYRYRCSYGGF